MSAIFKTLTGIIPSNQTAIVFTDNMIVDDSILDVFFSNDDIVVDDMTMSGNSVTVTISPQSYNVGVALFINNCEVFTPYDDTEVLNRLTIVETDTDTLNTEIGELDTEIGEINTELDTLTNTVNNKQDKLPDVVNDKYLHTNASTGALEWVTVQGGSSLVYSETETVIGTYNNKPLYAKICPVTRTTGTTANSWSSVADAPSDIERVVHIEFLRVNDALGTINSQYSRVYNGKIELYNTFTIGASAMTNASVVIEYTKVGD